ncbi:putative G-protein coupled receptors family 1 profile domain-containing protein [Seiridium unicorne]|uniref:G-protein coupled receptors family 1 profile domain-containing protein n=1 Tax=Seiridium unicorne TaxID=138068 RepID=A0ABR2UI84_9PEZI
MSLYSPPPPLHTFQEDKPTLLVCWWITLFCTTIILVRIAGRFIRSEKLFREDKTAALAIIPLFARMACLHVVFIFGTNNAQLPDNLSDEEIRRKTIGSGLVLASRVFYAATLWILKLAILEFFYRLTSTSWKRSDDLTLPLIRGTLLITFIGVIVSDLVECRPFSHYYQVLPDPGGQCRQGYVQLLTMAACNIVTDSLLVIFPVTIILKSRMGAKKKVQLTLLFSLSLGVVGTTAYRVPHIIWQDGSQQIRSLLASVELLFATAAANALVLGSFVRDRGVKKAKFRYGSITGESVDASILNSRRRPTMRNWGSDEDLIRSLGLRADRELRDEYGRRGPQYTPAPLAKLPDNMKDWEFPKRNRSDAERSDDYLLAPDQGVSRTNTETTPRRVSFFDVGGLLDDDRATQWRDSFNSSIDPLSPVLPYSALSPHSIPTPTIPAGSSGLRRGSQALLQDIGGLLTPPDARPSRPSPEISPRTTELQTMTHLRRGPAYAQDYRNQPELIDPGGLLR